VELSNYVSLVWEDDEVKSKQRKRQAGNKSKKKKRKDNATNSDLESRALRVSILNMCNENTLRMLD
jgi:hypothetical protein